MVKSVAFAVPGDLETPTGGYAYDRRIIQELQHLRWTVEIIALGDGFPRPSKETMASAQARLAAVAKGRPIVIDGLAFGVMPDVAAQLRKCNPLIAMVHHPLALETGLRQSEADALHVSEQAALTAATRIVTSSATTARGLVADYAVSADRIAVVPPGSDQVQHAVQVRGVANTVRLLAIGSIVPRKGYDILVAALALLADLAWHLTIAGDRSRDADTASRLDADIARHKLGDRVTVLGAISPDEVAALYSGADVFVLASRFEGYGMVYAEAMTHGLPVVGTNAGAIPEVVPASAGILVPPDDIAALAIALRRLIVSADERHRFAEGALAAATRLPSWQDSAKVFSRVIASVA